MRRILFYLLLILIGGAAQGQQRLSNNRTKSFTGIGDDLGNNMTQEDHPVCNRIVRRLKLPIFLLTYISGHYHRVLAISIQQLWILYGINI